jgi:hypothetical protein
MDFDYPIPIKQSIASQYVALEISSHRTQARQVLPDLERLLPEQTAANIMLELPGAIAGVKGGVANDDSE